MDDEVTGWKRQNKKKDNIGNWCKLKNHVVAQSAQKINHMLKTAT